MMCDLSGSERFSKRGTKVEYLMTLNGAEPVKYRQSIIDYHYYLTRQLAPIAEPVLGLLDKRFSDISSKQMSLI